MDLKSGILSQLGHSPCSSMVFHLHKHIHLHDILCVWLRELVQAAAWDQTGKLDPDDRFAIDDWMEGKPGEPRLWKSKLRLPRAWDCKTYEGEAGSCKTAAQDSAIRLFLNDEDEVLRIMDMCQRRPHGKPERPDKRRKTVDA